MEEETLVEVTRIWSILTSDKKKAVRRVFNRIPKERLSEEDLKRPEVAEQIAKSGFYDIDHALPEKAVAALDFLTDLGYLEKRNDTFYHVSFVYEAHPYVPYISPFGWVSIRHNSVSQMATMTFDSKEYQLFEATAKELKIQILDQMHKHITLFDYGLDFSYDSIVYEMKDKYFDAIKLSHSLKENRFVVHLAEPYVTSDGKKDRKSLKALEEIPETAFLSGSSEIDKYIQKLEWKKKSIGVVIPENEAFFLVPKDIAEEKEQEGSFLAREVPDFFDKGLYSPENFLSRVFEDSVTGYLISKFGYDATARLKPSYLDGKEIDVFAEKGISPKQITVCECKLRFNDGPITLDEVKYFHSKALKIKENESRRGGITFSFWLVTNTGKFGKDVENFAKENGIELQVARLTSDWRKRADFKVEEIRSSKSQKRITEESPMRKQ